MLLPWSVVNKVSWFSIQNMRWLLCTKSVNCVTVFANRFLLDFSKHKENHIAYWNKTNKFRSNIGVVCWIDYWYISLWCYYCLRSNQICMRRIRILFTLQIFHTAFSRFTQTNAQLTINSIVNSHHGVVFCFNRLLQSANTVIIAWSDSLNEMKDTNTTQSTEWSISFKQWQLFRCENKKGANLQLNEFDAGEKPPRESIVEMN